MCLEDFRRDRAVRANVIPCGNKLGECTAAPPIGVIGLQILRVLFRAVKLGFDSAAQQFSLEPRQTEVNLSGHGNRVALNAAFLHSCEGRIVGIQRRSNRVPYLVRAHAGALPRLDLLLQRGHFGLGLVCVLNGGEHIAQNLLALVETQ